MIIRCLCFLFISLSLAAHAYAQDAPEITLRGDAELGEFETDGLILEKLGVTVDVQSGLAQVSMTATLRNETDEDVEASFAYPLPAGAVINGYALDLEGGLVDGVLMPKERAESLYTDRVTAAVDPGIAARTADNRYRTRIYPIFAEGGKRSVRLDFTAPVPADGLRLPLSQDATVETVSIQISGDGAASARSPVTDGKGNNTVLSGGIFIPAVQATPSLSRYKGQNFLTVPLPAPLPEPEAKVQTDITSVAVIWDTSLSGKDGASATELQFVLAVLAAIEPEKQSLIRGADRIEAARTYDKPLQFSADLADLTYDGATDLSALLDAERLGRRDIDADICLLISDGHSSIGPGNGESGLPNLPCRVFTFSADKNPNTAYLSLLAARNNGADLSGLSARDAARRIADNTGYQLAPNQAGEIFTAGDRTWFILPVSETASRLNIQFEDGEQDVDLRRLSATEHRSASSLWGERRMAELRSKGPAGFDAVVEASRLYGVQGKETAFLVLEEVDDYIEAKIDPPTNFPAEKMETYKEDVAEAKREAAEDLADHLENILEDWKEQVEWWETDWVKLAREDDEDRKASAEAPQVVMPAPPPTSPQLASPPPPSPNFSCPDGTQVFDAGSCPVQALTEGYAAPEPVLADIAGDTVIMTASRVSAEDPQDAIVVSGVRISNPAGSLPSKITVSVKDWTPDRPYLKALSELKGDDFESEYFRQREDYGDKPSFYLEIADRLHRDGRTDRAARMAATALDLPSASMITRANVADRLLMYGRTETAIALYREILPTAQHRPQPFYNLALALIQAGDASRGETRETYYREAFRHLVHVINNHWEDDYEGIHLIAVQDLNRTLARLPTRTRRKIQKELGLDKAFYQNLDVDVRVLVDWTGDDADIDLHVIERVEAADDEEAYYGNDETLMGGRISNDMTDGYGPEEYLIRRAPNGLYRATTDYFDEDAYTVDGAMKIRARIWRNFGRASETQDTIIIEMAEEKDDDYILGEIQIGPEAKQKDPVAEEPETE